MLKTGKLRLVGAPTAAPAVAAAPPVGKPAKPAKRDVARRWTATLARSGFTPVVGVFLENYSTMQPPITNSEAMFIIHLMSYKWDDDLPWPAFKTLAKRMGISDTAARTHARKLEVSKRYLTRIRRTGQPNKFDLSPLFVALEKVQAERKAAKGVGAKVA